MRIISVNVSGISEVVVGRRRVRTGIFKKPAGGPLTVGRLGLQGDKQADLSVHGGRDKAVYVYAADHYTTWSRELGRALAYGAFGENLTVEGAGEDAIRIGDMIRAGTALVQVTLPRAPCYKLGIAMGDETFVRTFLASGRTGFYLRIIEEGVLQEGDAFDIVERQPGEPSIAELVAGAAARARRADARSA